MLNLDGVSPGYPIPDYLYEGQEVFTSFDGQTITKCRVVVAFGDAGWVVDGNGVEKLVSRWHLRIKAQK